MRLRWLGEFGLIKRIKKALPPPDKSVILGIGDDAAAVRHSSEAVTLITSDMLLEGIHFDSSLSSHFDIGFKALSVNISDISAMGGKPTLAIASIGISEKTSLKEIDDIFEGLKKASMPYGISIIGGDTCRSSLGLILSITLLGEIEEDLLVSRSGARRGDAIFVTGTLGDSAMGLELLKKGSVPAKAGITVHSSQFLIERHLMPKPRVEEGRRIARNKWATSMIDVSDGLLSDLLHICEEGSVGARIYEERIPLSAPLKKVASRLNKDPLGYALRGGEDYELLFTVPEKKVGEVMKAKLRGRSLATLIGEVVKRERVLIDKKGRKKPLLPLGYDHFSRGY